MLIKLNCRYVCYNYYYKQTYYFIQSRSQKVSVEKVALNKSDLENENFLTISKIVEQKQVFEKRFKYRKVVQCVLTLPCLQRHHVQDQLEDTTYEESTFKSEEVREVVKYSPAAAHEVLRAIAEKTGMNPQVELSIMKQIFLMSAKIFLMQTKLRVNGELRRLTSKTLLQMQVSPP